MDRSNTVAPTPLPRFEFEIQLCLSLNRMSPHRRGAVDQTRTDHPHRPLRRTPPRIRIPRRTVCPPLRIAGGPPMETSCNHHRLRVRMQYDQKRLPAEGGTETRPRNTSSASAQVLAQARSINLPAHLRPSCRLPSIQSPHPGPERKHTR